MVQFASTACRWCDQVCSQDEAGNGATSRSSLSSLYDPGYVASKKVKQEDKDKEQEFLDTAAKEIYKQNYMDGALCNRHSGC